MAIQNRTKHIDTLLGKYCSDHWLTQVQAENAGLTLMECLVAIVMVAIVMGAIAPALVISVATRVQSQKAEKALELAQSEIDRVRLSVERDGVAATGLPASTTTVGETDVADAVGPTNTFNDPPDWDEVRAVDIDGGGPDFAVQTYRTEGQPDGDGNPVAFAMGVRVYDFDAVSNLGSGNMLTEKASLGTTAGEGQRAERPLAALYTTIAVSEEGNSLCELTRYLSTAGSAASVPLGCD
jgi:prepilin-type N-terminal cleavage/methylation domain-containing protein